MPPQQIVLRRMQIDEGSVARSNTGLEMLRGLLISRLQGDQWVALGNELVGKITGVAGLFNCPENGRIVEFLVLVQIVATGIARRVIMTDVVLRRTNGADDVSFHDLHMVDVI
jgi:hypothetical protein